MLQYHSSIDNSYSETHYLHNAYVDSFQIFIFHISDSNLRQQFNHVQDPKLQQLAEALPEVVKQSKAENTQKKYNRGFDRWRKWACNFREVSVLPACSVYVALFFLNIIQNLL